METGDHQTGSAAEIRETAVRQDRTDGQDTAAEEEGVHEDVQDAEAAAQGDRVTTENGEGQTHTEEQIRGENAGFCENFEASVVHATSQGRQVRLVVKKRLVQAITKHMKTE
uniref:Uncharacterized protein n=1 Tax=Clastoptera arizonana TaxID=38151 RepID=A0A1B6DTT7_9HEMI